MRFCRFVKTTIKGYQASCEQIFHVLVVWNLIFADSWNQRFKVPREECKNFLPFWGLKMRFYLFVKSTYQAACQEIWRMYQASCEEIFCILAVWKCDCCRFVKLTFQGISSCLRPENAILPSREINVSKVPSFVGAIFPQVPRFVWTNYPHFVCLKMRFLPIREIKVSRKEGDILIIFFIILIFPRWEIHVSSLAWLRFVLLCLVWLCLAWFGLAWLGLSWLGLAWLGLAWLS